MAAENRAGSPCARSVRAWGDHPVEGFGDGTFALPRGVLVAEGGLVGGVVKVVHDLFGAGTGTRCQGAGEVAEVEQVDLGIADLGAGRLPGVLPDVRRARFRYPGIPGYRNRLHSPHGPPID